MKQFYRHRLPHWQPPGATIFITYRLFGSLPKEVIERLAEEKRRLEREPARMGESHRDRALREGKKLFALADNALDAALVGPKWLARDDVARIIIENLFHHAGQLYKLWAFVVMANHAHVLVEPSMLEAHCDQEDATSFVALKRITHALKSFTAKRANGVLNRNASFWQEESFDHWARDEKEFARIITYIENNPVKAGLVDSPEKWKWSSAAFERDENGECVNRSAGGSPALQEVLMRLGAHMSIAGGVENAVLRGHSVGCEAIAMFTKNNNQWKAKKLTKEDADKFNAALIETGIKPVVAHTSYLINLASPAAPLWKKSIASMEDELMRCELLGIPYLVLHPGSHMKKGIDYGIQRAAEAFNRIHEKLPNLRVMTLLEHTAGQGSNLCCTFEEVGKLRELIVDKKRIGVCVDSCHLFAAGFDLRKPDIYANTFKRFDDCVGIEHIKAWHLNDSKTDLGSHVDRHEHIGKGKMGKVAFKNILNDPRWRDLPGVLETPKDEDMKDDKMNLRTLRSLIAE